MIETSSGPFAKNAVMTQSTRLGLAAAIQYTVGTSAAARTVETEKAKVIEFQARVGPQNAGETRELMV